MSVSERASTVAIVRMDEATIGILAPLPHSLTGEELRAALDSPDASPVDFEKWLTNRLLGVTKRRYLVVNDFKMLERDGYRIVYEAVRITDMESEPA
jgi:hypothetical protein